MQCSKVVIENKPSFQLLAQRYLQQQHDYCQQKFSWCHPTAPFYAPDATPHLLFFSAEHEGLLSENLLQLITTKVYSNLNFTFNCLNSKLMLSRSATNFLLRSNLSEFICLISVTSCSISVILSSREVHKRPALQFLFGGRTV